MGPVNRLIKNEKATATVIMAVAMTFLAGFCALAIDTGLIYLNKCKMYNALDSAVLAGVQELPDKPENALLISEEYAVFNGIAAGQAAFTVDVENRTVTGRSNKQIQLVFARAIGFESSIIQAQAKARIAPVSAVIGVVPFGVLEADYKFGQQVILKQGGGDGEEGWFGALQLGGHGAYVYLGNTELGYTGEVKVGDIISTETGNMSGPTETGIEYRINQCNHVPQCTPESFQQDCPRILIVPIINLEDLNPAGHTFSVKVVGFGAFLVEEYVGSGIDNEVIGKFIHYVVPGKVDGTAADFGLYAAQLCE